MSATSKITQNNTSNCCRNCSGDIWAKYVITKTQTNESKWEYRGIEGPNITKSCDRSLKQDADVKLDFELGNKLADAFETKINALINIGYYLEKDKIWKIGASFKVSACADSGEINIDIEEFRVNIWG